MNTSDHRVLIITLAKPSVETACLLSKGAMVVYALIASSLTQRIDLKKKFDQLNA
jgi:hypothetical protein